VTLAILCICAASFTLHLIALSAAAPWARRRLRHGLKRECVDEGIALAQRAVRTLGLPKDHLSSTAVDHADEQLRSHGVQVPRAELRKLVEARLEQST
jgi:hypothetical protein